MTDPKKNAKRIKPRVEQPEGRKMSVQHANRVNASAAMEGARLEARDAKATLFRALGVEKIIRPAPAAEQKIVPAPAGAKKK